jgi:hypothetical protein
MGGDKPPTPEQIAYLCLVHEVWDEIEAQLECSVEEYFENIDDEKEDDTEE